MSEAIDCTVLIVGAGPAGVAAAILLAQHGVDVLVIDKAADIYPLPRAAHFDHEAMRILQAMGVADGVSKASRTASRYDFLTADRQLLMRFESDPVNSPSGWPSANMIHQPSVERLLRDRLAALPAARLNTGWTLSDFSQDSDGVAALVATPAGARTIRARYLIGCDGASSLVRQKCGVGQSDLQFDEPWLVIDVLVQDGARLPTDNLQICDPARPTTCVLMAPGRHRWEFMLLPGESAEDIIRDDAIARLLQPWDVDGAVTIERKAVYRFHALIAAQWRIGRVLLAGDAAHQMPPFAGQGLCSGLRDASNLAWKLAAVLRGDAGEALLDTYQIERGPHVRAITDMALMMGRTVCITDPAAAAARDAAMLAQRAQAQGGSPPPAPEWPAYARGLLLHAAPGAGEVFPQPVVDAGAERARLDDMLGAGWWLIARTAAAIGVEAGGDLKIAALDAPGFAAVRAPLTQWLDRRGVDCVLVRPDRYVFGAGDARALVAARDAQMAA